MAFDLTLIILTWPFLLAWHGLGSARQLGIGFMTAVNIVGNSGKAKRSVDKDMAMA